MQLKPRTYSRIADIKKTAFEEGRKSAEKDTTIVGPAEGGTSTATTPTPTLSPQQQRELDMLNQDSSIQRTPQEYLQTLKNKEVRFKSMGAKNVPTLLNDQPIV